MSVARSEQRPDARGGHALVIGARDVDALVSVALRLDYMIGQITPEEFHWQDANYDRDSALGRELLFLIANREWVRATSEEINIVRSDAIDTMIRVDVDLDRITHEAFGGRAGQLWLPVVVLPPLLKPQPSRPYLAEPLSEPDPFSTLTVADADGMPLVTPPSAEVRHRVAAALAEIIVNIAGTRQQGVVAAGFSATRDHRLLLSAAIYRMLRAEHVPTAVLNRQVGARRTVEGPLPRIDRVRTELGDLLKSYSDLLANPQPAGNEDATAARELARRATQVLKAFAESAIVVVAADRGYGPAVLTVTVPSRALHLAPPRWAGALGPVTAPARRWARPDGWRWLRPGNWVLPRATLELDLLLPSADADRQVQVNLPDGVSPDPSLSVDARAELDIRTEQPTPVGQLAKLTGQLVSVAEDWPPTLCMCLADLCAAKADAAWASLRDHRVGARFGEPSVSRLESTCATREFRERLDQVGGALRHIAAVGPDPEARSRLGAAWKGGEWLDAPIQRRTSADTISPDIVAARARLVEDVSQRAALTEARMQVHVAVTDSEYVTTAKLSGWMSTLLMIVVLLFFAGEHALGLSGRRVSAEVLALVLTLFSAIQAGRIERPDRSTLRGLLVPAGNPLIIVSILPPVILAVALAFYPGATRAIAWASACIGAQLLLLWLQWLLLWRAFARGRRRAASAAPKAGLVFYTDTPDYQHNQVLHSDWWRSATAEALMLGRRAYGYVVWQHETPQALGSLLHGARPAGGPRSSARQRSPRLPDWLPSRWAIGQPASTWTADSSASQDQAGGRSGPADQGADLGVSALEQPANVIALQRSGTGLQSVTFAVFRDEPKADWDCQPEDIVTIDLDPGRLTPSENPAGIVGIFLGLRPGHGLLRIPDHPVTAVLKAAADHRLAVIEVQLPVPAPSTAYADLQWARVRLALRDENTTRLAPFLADIQKLAEKARRSGRPSSAQAAAQPIVGVQTISEGIPRILNPRPAAANPGPRAGRNGHARTRLVLASDLDVVAASGVRKHESAAAKTWRVMAVSTDWRPGIEAEILASLDAELRLAGLTMATFYGQAVLLLVGHQQGGPAPASDAPPAQPGSDGVVVHLDKWQSRTELGAAQRYPLLRVHMRTPDRPGATFEVLQSLRDSLQEIAPGYLGAPDWNVWYARAVVADGRTAQVQLTIRLGIDPDGDFPGKPVGEWGPAEFTRIERQALALAASRMDATRHAGGSTAPSLDSPEDTVIRVGLVSMPDLD